MTPFPSIEQFRTVIRNVKNHVSFMGCDENGEPIYNPTAKLPTLDYVGTVKLHGTNAAMVYDNGKISYQSRSNVLGDGMDNAGFKAAMCQNTEWFEYFCDDYINVNGNAKIVVFGEWCGGNIQAGVAINALPKMFVIFDIQIIHTFGTSRFPIGLLKSYIKDVDNVFVITEFPTYKITIDFENPHLTQNEMIKMTEAVEAECPVGLAFGKSGIGEGIVWRPVDPAYASSKFWFKVKGEKHSSSKVKTLAAVDVEVIEAMNEFIEYAVTENRLNQGLENIPAFDIKNLGEFIRWVYNDIIKEESDVLRASGIDEKKLGGAVAKKARNWFMEKL